MNIKEKILFEIENNSLEILAFQYEYLRLFKKMDSINKNLKSFSNVPNNFFEEFNFELYQKRKRKINLDLLKIKDLLPKNSNIIITINGFLSKQHSILNFSGIQLIETLQHTNPYFLKDEQICVDYFENAENQNTILNGLLLKEKINIEIQSNGDIIEPIYLINIVDNIDDNFLLPSRKLITIKSNSNVDIIELNFSFSHFDFLMNDIFILKVEDNSKVNFSKFIINFPEQNYQSRTSFLRENGYFVGKNSCLKINSIYLKSYFFKENSFVFLDENNAEVTNNIFANTNQNRIIDLKLIAFHRKSNTKSNINFKAIADNESSVNFTGSIIMKQGINNIESQQNCKAFLLSDKSKINISPELEINTDDVKATHGVAIGLLDEDQIFYLKSRGIDYAKSKKILLSAFSNEIIQNVPITENLKNYVLNVIENNL